MLTIFVALVLLIGTLVFTADAQRLVLDPIERMMSMVEEVSKDPLRPITWQHQEGSGEYETRLLESTIDKITGLLRIGFGEAGARIISENLSAESGSKINPLIPGLRIYAFFGFCDIHHFEEVLEKLEKEIMTFVNTIAAIVHNRVHGWLGQSNKNLGNAFLVVWRIGDEKTLMQMLTGGSIYERQKSMSVKKVAQKDDVAAQQEVDLRRVAGADMLADRALVGYLKIIAEINRDMGILSYRKHARLVDHDHEFKVRMGFGLHAGWAIEGAVGSIQKVDATYLSPHVNMAARLETSSKQYGVPLLLSERVYEVMSSVAKEKCRRLDIVTVKGSEFPIGIYTYDCLQDQVFPSKTRSGAKYLAASQNDNSEIGSEGNINTNADVKHTNSESSEDPLKSATQENYFAVASDSSADIFARDSDLLALRKHVTKEFEVTFQSAVDEYIAGKWLIAKPLFEKANALMLEAAPSLGGDGPSQTLLRYMEARHFDSASVDWKGYRPLTSK